MGQTSHSRPGLWVPSRMIGSELKIFRRCQPQPCLRPWLCKPFHKSDLPSCTCGSDPIVERNLSHSVSEDLDLSHSRVSTLVETFKVVRRSRSQPQPCLHTWIVAQRSRSTIGRFLRGYGSQLELTDHSTRLSAQVRDCPAEHNQREELPWYR